MKSVVEGHTVSLILQYITNLCQQTAWKSPQFSHKNLTCKVLCTKNVDSRNRCFGLFVRTHFLTGVELQVFDRMCTFAGIIEKTISSGDDM